MNSVETMIFENIIPHRIHSRDGSFVGSSAAQFNMHIFICWDTFWKPQTKTRSNKVNDSRF